MAVEQVYLVRHGETDYNAAGRWQGHLQTQLSDTGKAQAQALGTYLQPAHLDAIYTSDLDRAVDTARFVAEGRNITPICDARLREVHLGIFQGLTRQQILDTYPLEHERWHHDDHYTVPQGESRMTLQARMVAAWQDIIATETGKTILIVSHGGSIRWLLSALFQPELLKGRGIGNTSLTTLNRLNNSWQLVEFAALPHWPDAR